MQMSTFWQNASKLNIFIVFKGNKSRELDDRDAPGLQVFFNKKMMMLFDKY